jgi:hypothetical protein
MLNALLCNSGRYDAFQFWGLLSRACYMVLLPRLQLGHSGGSSAFIADVCPMHACMAALTLHLLTVGLYWSRKGTLLWQVCRCISLISVVKHPLTVLWTEAAAMCPLVVSMESWHIRHFKSWLLDLAL